LQDILAGAQNFRHRFSPRRDDVLIFSMERRPLRRNLRISSSAVSEIHSRFPRLIRREQRGRYLPPIPNPQKRNSSTACRISEALGEARNEMLSRGVAAYYQAIAVEAEYRNSGGMR